MVTFLSSPTRRRGAMPPRGGTCPETVKYRSAPVDSRVVLPLLTRIAALLPEGRLLPEPVWRRRHTVLVRIAAIQAVGLGLLSALTGHALLGAVTSTLAILLPLPFALPAEFRREVRAAATTVSL